MLILYKIWAPQKLQITLFELWCSLSLHYTNSNYGGYYIFKNHMETNKNDFRVYI